MGHIIWSQMMIYFIRKQKKRSDINGFIKLHVDATQEHSALFLQKCNTPLNRVHASRSVTTSDFLSWLRNVLHILPRFSDHKHLKIRSSSLNLTISNWDILTIWKFLKLAMIQKTFLSGRHSVFSTFWDECDVQIDTFPRNKLSSNSSLIIKGLLVTLRESFDSMSGRFHVTGQTEPLSAQVWKCLSYQASTDRVGQQSELI